MPFDPQAHKAAILKHCLWMAERDPDYAIAAAEWYERNDPTILRNLKRVVKREVSRCATCWPAAADVVSARAVWISRSTSGPSLRGEGSANAA